MKKLLILVIVFLALVFGAVMMNKNDKNMIKVAEVTHSVFYAPQYIALEEGYFSEYGLNVDIILTPGADKVTAALLSGDVQIGLCGSEASIYVYNQGEKDYIVNFAGLTKRDGSFLVSREKIDNFNINMLEGKHIIGGRKGGMPALTLEWALKQNGVNANVDTSIEYGSMSGAFISGIGDYVTIFEPGASKIEQEGYGYIVSAVGTLGGTVPYTVYNARKSFIDNNPQVIANFKKAIQKGLDFIHNNTNEDIANKLLKYFPDTSLNDLVIMVDNHKKIDSWYKDTIIPENDFMHMQDIINEAGLLDKYVNYNDLVYVK